MMSELWLCPKIGPSNAPGLCRQLRPCSSGLAAACGPPDITSHAAPLHITSLSAPAQHVALDEKQAAPLWPAHHLQPLPDAQHSVAVSYSAAVTGM